MRNKNYLSKEVSSGLFPYQRAKLIIENYRAGRKLLTPEEHTNLRVFNNDGDLKQFDYYVNTFILSSNLLQHLIRQGAEDIIFAFESLMKMYFQLHIEFSLAYFRVTFPTDIDDTFADDLLDFFHMVGIVEHVYNNEQGIIKIKINDQVREDVLPKVNSLRAIIRGFMELLEVKRVLQQRMPEMPVLGESFENRVQSLIEATIKIRECHNAAFQKIAELYPWEADMGKVNKKILQDMYSYLICEPHIDPESVQNFIKYIDNFTVKYH